VTDFKNKYRIETTRLKSWNYAWQGVYYLTICTKDRQPFFGRIEDNLPVLSDIGLIAKKEWVRTVELRPDMNITLGEFVVMPDHIHGIVRIGDNEFNSPHRDAMHGNGENNSDQIGRDAMQGNVGNNECNTPRRDAMHRVSTGKTAHKHGINGFGPHKQFPQNQFGPQRKNLASIMRGYKSAVSIQSRKIRPDFGWQPRFYDHIIRDESELERITNYIKDNPRRWAEKQGNNP
jgi:putative transposase